ncbi:hypothetical protein PHLGIDRAFT_119740 [Phlebiopsis gigantea 11061_1 CR5-6]|uniref:Peptidase A1 domain-containing protein n=1 Tax=Phlebiopsis gigantea (strain 11061_1 CR5-6) TaxID=745531 RepID=A0A0C3RVU3_PHLG1|nr:hypothetical protein PHLGIDRAFT_119740 [Phlebiopsis gigantea 11061_1 CR5-6]
MFAHLAVTVTLALLTAATPVVVRQSPITIPLARRFNFTGTKTLRELDLARVQKLRSGTKFKSRPDAAPASASASSFPVTVVNGAVTYTAEVLVGSSQQAFNLIVDTGSSNTWAGANTFGNPFTPSSTTQNTGELMEVTYGSGFVFGNEVVDTVQLGDLVISGQSMGAAILSEGFDGVDGILGIGPTDLTEDTTSAGGTVPTVTDNAFTQGLLASKEVGISFAPTTNESDPNGQLTFGGIDTSKFTGSLTTVPITTTSPSSEFVGIDQSITFGSAETPVLASTAGIVDTGTTLILIASDAFATYEELTGGVMDETTGLLRITPAQFSNLQSLFFNIGGTAFEFTPNAQIWPRALNTAIGGQADQIFLVVSDLGTASGSGMDFINGFTWLERFFFLWDSVTPQAGFATTPFTDATTN